MTSQPSTNQSAYYDPSTNGIWYPKSSGGVVGRVVDGADGLGKLKGKRIRGEILEISDAPVEKISRDDRGEHQTETVRGVQKHRPEDTKYQSTSKRRVVSQTALLQKQSIMHQEHTPQIQSLLAKHKKERQTFISIPMPSEKQRELAISEMENRHQKELLDMQEAQNREKLEVMQELIAGVTVFDEGQHEQHQATTTAGETSAPSMKSGSSYSKKDSMDSISNSISKASVASMPAALPSHHDEPMDRSALEAQKSAEIKALMRDKSLDRETRRQMLIDIKSKYSNLMDQAPEPAAAVDSAHQRKIELQAIMKDRTLSKEERLKKLAEVKQKYPLEGAHRRATTEAAPNRHRLKTAAAGAKSAGRIKRAVSSPVEPRKEKKLSSKSKPVIEELPPQVEDDESMGEVMTEQRKFTASAVWEAAGVKAVSAMKVSSVLNKQSDAEDPQSSVGSTQEDTVSSEEGDCVTELASSFKSRRRSSQDDSIDINVELLKSGGKWDSEPTTNIADYVPKSRRKSDDSQEKVVTISEPSSQNTSARSLKLDPLEHAEVNKTPIKTLIRKLEKNDPSMDVLRLDGRGKIKENDWETFFEALESNTTLTHLSLVRCGLTDDLIVNLILALVENSTLTALHLMSNKDITEITGKGMVKVLKESNTTLKQLDLSKTKVKKSTLKDIQLIMDVRDEAKQRAKAQRLRDNKVMMLLSTTASDAIAKSAKEFDLDSDDNSDASEDSQIKLGSSSFGASGQSLNKSYVSGKSNKSNKSAASNASSKKSASSKGSKSGSKAGSLQKKRPNRAGRGAGGGAMRASMTARQMATMGGDLVSAIGTDAKTLREQRKMKGECITCGQKCYEKKLFKTTPLTIPHKVFEGRCLKCNPMM